MSLLDANQLRQSPVYRFILEGLDRTTKEFEMSRSSEDRDAWRLMNYCYRLKQLVERRIELDNKTPDKSKKDRLSAECHELLEALLESIGLHANEKYIVIENLALRLRSSTNPGNVVHARNNSATTQILEIHNSVPLMNGSINGVVIEHFDKVAVIRFNVFGESEEREFFWDELNGTPETLPVGTAVIGETRLLRASVPPTDEEQDAEFQNAREQVLKDLKSQGIDPKAIVGTEPTTELRKKSARAWAENLKGHSPTRSNEG